MRLTLDERTTAGRLGLRLLDVRAAIASAQHPDEIERFREEERTLNDAIVREVLRERAAVIVSSLSVRMFGNRPVRTGQAA